MTTGPEHLTQVECWAERALEELRNGAVNAAAVAAAVAQAHATAALASATVTARFRGRDGEARAWLRHTRREDDRR